MCITIQTVVFANDIRSVILKLAEECGTEKTFGPSDVARAVDQKNWKVLRDQVKLVAGVLVHEGKIIATRSGKIIDSNHMNGSLRFRKPI
jgi:hypothetical protein